MNPYGAQAEKGRAVPRVLIFCAVDFTVRRFLTPLARTLSNSGCDVRIACTPGPYWDGLVSDGFRMVRLPMARSWNLLSHLLTAVRLFRHLKREKIDILHVHTPVAGLLGRIVGRLAGVPVILYTAHGFYFHENMRPLARRLHVLLEKIGARFHDHLFLVSEEDAKAAEALGIEAPARTTIIRNGVKAAELMPELLAGSRPRLREELGIPPDAPVVIMVGRLTREKGPVDLLRAARRVVRRVPDVHFVIVGGVLSSERDRVQRHVRRIADEPRLRGRVHLLGFREDVPELLAASDLFVLPSWREGLPVSVIEAMMVGLPVVATNVRGCREAVRDGTTGLLVPLRDGRNLAGAITYLLRHRDIATRLGSGGRRRAQDSYEEAPHLEVQWNVYQRLIRERLT
jgi:glycosyltransferase involved in cell wall biosynthesis